MNPESVKMVDNKLLATLVPSKEQTTDLELVATILPNDLIRLHVSEQNPLNGRHRFEATDVLIPGMLLFLIGHIESVQPQSMVISSQDANQVVFESPNKHVRCEITYNPLHIAFYIDSELKLTLNDKNLFYFEITRQKPNSTNSPESSSTVNPPTPPPKETKEIVDYTEAGKAIYADGTVEGENVETEETEETVEVTVDNTSETPVPETPEEEGKEDETGAWEEYFGGKTDSKPYGPQVSFPSFPNSSLWVWT